MRLTESTVTALSLPDGKSELFFWDGDVPGFGLRLRKARAASRYVFQYRANGRQRRVTIGTLTAISAAQARRAASDLHAKVRLGADPAGERAEGRARAAETVGALLKPYLEFKRPHLAPRSLIETQRYLLKHFKPLHPIPVAKLDRRTIASRLSAIAADNGPSAANRTADAITGFLGWCIGQGVIDSNPAVGVTRQPEKARERVLTDDELVAIWRATSDVSDYSAVVRLLMLTACRLREIALLRWSEIADHRILLPPHRCKNRRAHSIPLVPLAAEIVAGRGGVGDLIFGLMSNNWTNLKTALDKRLGGQVAPWTHHDLRRTVATGMANLGVQPHVIEAVLNHVSGHKSGVAAVYNRSSYEPEKRAALERWADHVQTVTKL
jgi:integrase